MTVRALLCWHSSSKRWFKRYKPPGEKKHRTFCISARQLSELTGCPPTKTGSLVAANDWWTVKQAELQAGTGLPDSLAAAISARLLKDAAAAVKLGDTATSRILSRAAAEVQRRRAAGIRIPEYDHDEGKFLRPAERSPRNRLSAELHDIADTAAAVLELNVPAASGKFGTIGEAVQDYLQVRLHDVDAGTLSRGRYSWLNLALGRIVSFAGETSDLSGIDGDALVRFRAHLLSADFGAGHAQECLGATRQFLRWCWETKRIDELPRNLSSRSLAISVPKSEPKSFTVDEVKLILQHSAEKLRLFVLLALNCGMTQVDIAALRPGEYDPASRTITRRRTKTATHDNVPTVTYRLWNTTCGLLERFRTKNPERLLLGPNGLPLKTEKLSDKGKLIRSDYIALLFRRYMHALRKRAVVDSALPFKVFRKTAANLIRADLGVEYSGLFLGHSPRSLQDISYTRQSQEKFDAGVRKLGEVLGQV